MERRQVEAEMQRALANASPLARTAACNITRAAEPCRDGTGWAVLAVMMVLVFVSGVMWLAEARDELREVHRDAHRAAEARPCR